VSERIVFALVPIDSLRAHEKIVRAKVRELAKELRESGVFVEPIWVAEGSCVILNGHHRTAALRLLGAKEIPAWVVDYASDAVRLARWRAGPPISKEEVVRRGTEGRLFPPRTTRHILEAPLPRRPTPLDKLGVPRVRTKAQSRRSRSVRASRAGASSPR
jgi:L-serine kinase (ADP)